MNQENKNNSNNLMYAVKEQKGFLLPSTTPQVIDVMVIRSIDGLQEIVAMTSVNRFGVESSTEILKTYEIGKYTRESLESFIGRDPDEMIRKVQQSQNESTELLAVIQRLFVDPSFTTVIDPAYITESGETADTAEKLYNVAIEMCRELISEPWPNPYTIKMLSDAGFEIGRTYIMTDGYLTVHNDYKMMIYDK